MLSKYSVKKPLTVLVAIIIIAILGGVSYTNMTVDMLPSMNLPYAIVSKTYIGASPEEIFAGYHDVKNVVGADEMKNIPLGAIAVWTLADKLTCGLQQIMAGARKFDVKDISRDDLFSANRETEKETGIPFMTDINDEVAKKILKG